LSKYEAAQAAIGAGVRAEVLAQSVGIVPSSMIVGRAGGFPDRWRQMSGAGGDVYYGVQNAMSGFRSSSRAAGVTTQTTYTEPSGELVTVIVLGCVAVAALIATAWGVTTWHKDQLEIDNEKSLTLHKADRLTALAHEQFLKTGKIDSGLIDALKSNVSVTPGSSGVRDWFGGGASGLTLPLVAGGCLLGGALLFGRKR
jgi:hypothetical protein